MLLTLCLTHDCNLRCSYCYAGRKFKHGMNRHTAQRAIDLALNETRASSHPKLTLRFFGGEPLMEWDVLTECVDYATRKCRDLKIDLVLGITTNGTLLTKRRIAWLRQHDFHLGLSMDGNAAMHDVLRRFSNGRSSHQRSLKSLKLLQSHHPSFSFEVILVPDPRNVQHLAKSVQWLVDEGVCNITINPNFYIDWPEELRNKWVEQYKAVGDIYVNCYRRGEALRVNVIDGKIKTGISGGYRACDTCSFGEDEIAISPSGNIYPCERLVSDDTDNAVQIGNVFDGFDDDKRQQILSHRKPVNTECIDCNYRSRCMNWCCCINYATSGRTDSVHAIVCHHEQIAIGVADAVAGTLYREANPIFLAKFYPTDLANFDDCPDPL